MDTLFAKYFDGDLDDREAKAFLEAVELDPKLERELRAYERVLALGTRLPDLEAPEGFTKRVMASVTESEPHGWFGWLPRFSLARLGPLATAAAAVVLAFVAGWWVARDAGRQGAPSIDSARPVAVPSDVVPLLASQRSADVDGYRYVRLAYVTDDPSIRQVQVAGSFNDWDPNATPMRRQDGVWSTILVLPPGSHEYMFVVDGARWLTDPLAVQTSDDGFGGSNAVLEVNL
jgi:hypothetical protein